MSNDEIGVGVIGVGFVGGQAHAPAFKKIPNSKLIGLADKIEERVKPLAHKYSTEYFLDYPDLVNHPDVQAIVVATPTPFHYKMVKSALENGKHVLCEMPLTPTLKEAEELKNIAAQNNVLLMPDLNFRFTPNYVKVKELLDKGSIGNPVGVCFREFIPAKDLSAQWPAGSWAYNKEISGGYPDFTLSVWSIDLLRWLFGAEYASIQWETNYVTLEEFGGILGYTTIGLVKMTNDLTGTLLYSSMVPTTAGTSYLDIYGEKACTLHAEWNNLLFLTGEEPAKQQWTFRVGGTKVWGHYQIDEHFINRILGKAEPKVTIDDALKSIEIASKMVK